MSVSWKSSILLPYSYHALSNAQDEGSPDNCSCPSTFFMKSVRRAEEKTEAECANKIRSPKPKKEKPEYTSTDTAPGPCERPVASKQKPTSITETMSTSSSWTWTMPGPFGRPCVVASLDKAVRRRKKSPRKSGSKDSPVWPEIRNVSVDPWFQNPRKNAENGEKWKKSFAGRCIYCTRWKTNNFPFL